MCLNIDEFSVSNRVTDSVECYKVLKRILTSQVRTSLSGVRFKGTINSYYVEGKIYTNPNSSDVFFCTNEPALNGSCGLSKLGYHYSWAWDEAVQADSIYIQNGDDEWKPLWNIENTILTTYYREEVVEIGKTYTSALVIDVDVVEVGIHSFKTLKDAKNLLSPRWNRVYVKCEIPNSSQYIEGRFNGFSSYASNALTYLSIVE